MKQVILQSDHVTFTYFEQSRAKEALRAFVTKFFLECYEAYSNMQETQTKSHLATIWERAQTEAIHAAIGTYSETVKLAIVEMEKE